MRKRLAVSLRVALVVLAAAGFADHAAACADRAVVSTDTQTSSLAVELREGTLGARTAPRLNAPLVRRFGPRTPEGVTRVFRVLGALGRPDCSALWYHVELPVRPNGATGWVRASGLYAYRVPYRLRIERRLHRLSIYLSGKLIEQLAIAVGTAQTPTPLGEYYVFERLSVAIASGPYGPGALGLSAFSPVLTGWTRGGPIAIHGTRDPTSIGHDASNGCVRVANRPMKRLLRQIPAGTPVQIVD